LSIDSLHEALLLGLREANLVGSLLGHI